MYVLRRGFLDGWPGLICAVMGSYYTFLKYAKLWELTWVRDPEEERVLDLIDCGMSEPARACREFLSSLEAGRAAPTDAHDNIKSLAMAWAAQLSSDEGRVVQISEIVGPGV